MFDENARINYHCCGFKLSKAFLLSSKIFKSSFDADIKTTDQAQNCPQVAPHFNLANTLALAIDNALRDGDIEWDDDYLDIIYEQNLKIVF
ncbi:MULTISPECIES: hypothetical protein [Olivibacter]|jgi:hypothetical protein|uniref:Uncharacterized protein n=1 Tax=Olivibacter jilunii TaxID=985016 RepID=A0ABW6B7M1_9SPHI|nr:hypothetical protein [Olivibacter jilunii]